MKARRGGMYICSKLGQNLSEMEARTFVSIQRVNWDSLLAFKPEIIQKQALFLFPCRTVPNNYQLAARYPLSALFFLSFSFLARRGHFFV